MKTTILNSMLLAIILTSSCGNAEKNTTGSPSGTEKATGNGSANASQADDIIGEWQLKILAQDNNGNKVLDEDERNAGNTKMNEYFKFNSDGSCLFYHIKLKGRYEIKNENGKKVIYVYDKDNQEAYELVLGSVSRTELILLEYGGGVSFHVFKRL